MIQTLMTVDGDGTGDFVNWLKELGLSDSFLRDYPIAQLVEWGWLRPQFRIVFPSTFFDEPATETITWPPQWRQPTSALEQVWLNEWPLRGEQEAMWFLHPFFRPDSEAYKLMEQNSATAGLPAIPPPFKRADGRVITPFADYYFPWQAYALIDVIRAADIFPQSHHFLDTPDSQKRAQSLLRLSKTPSWNPQRKLDADNGWAAWSEPLTWLAHYRALKATVDWQEIRGGDCSGLLRSGAAQLAAHLGIDAAQLETAVKERLLVLAQNWKWANDQNCRWVSPAWGVLRTEVYLAVEWICLLNGRTLDDYLDKWRYSHFGQQTWAELESILPFEWHTDREYFLTRSPHYLSNYNTRLTKKYRLENDHLRDVVNSISSKSRHFNSFLSSFRKLHKELNSTPQKAGGMDFRHRNPLDYYLLLAIRAETCLRAELVDSGKLGANASLEFYLRQLSTEIRLDGKATACYESHFKDVSDLRAMPTDFIERISALVTSTGCSQAPIGQGMLCCLAARNYFAHHDYHDRKLLNDQSSQFLLGGILLAVLTLLSGGKTTP